jgi:hypothetical protein
MYGWEAWFALGDVVSSVKSLDGRVRLAPCFTGSLGRYLSVTLSMQIPSSLMTHFVADVD